MDNFRLLPTFMHDFNFANPVSCKDMLWRQEKTHNVEHYLHSFIE